MTAPFSPPIAHVGSEKNELTRYWSDPVYRARIDRETAHAQALANEARDRAQIENGTRWPSCWSEDEKAEASERLLRSYRK